MPRKPAELDPALPIIARNMTAIREDLRLQQGDVAERAGVPRGQLSRWEHGHQKPEVDALLKLATVYECSVEDFVAGVNEAYDTLTERGIGANVRRHYQARYAELKNRALKAFDAITGAERTAPPPTDAAASHGKARGKSSPVRPRRKR